MPLSPSLHTRSLPPSLHTHSLPSYLFPPIPYSLPAFPIHYSPSLALSFPTLIRIPYYFISLPAYFFLYSLLAYICNLLFPFPSPVSLSPLSHSSPSSLSLSSPSPLYLSHLLLFLSLSLFSPLLAPPPLTPPTTPCSRPLGAACMTPHNVGSSPLHQH